MSAGIRSNSQGGPQVVSRRSGDPTVIILLSGNRSPGVLAGRPSRRALPRRPSGLSSSLDVVLKARTFRKPSTAAAQSQRATHESLGFDRYARTRADPLSGGTLSKLNLGLALLPDPGGLSCGSSVAAQLDVQPRAEPPWTVALLDVDGERTRGRRNTWRRCHGLAMSYLVHAGQNSSEPVSPQQLLR